jgi:hypothetical protein
MMKLFIRSCLTIKQMKFEFETWKLEMKSLVEIQRFGDMLHVFKWFTYLYASYFVSKDNISIN